MCAKSYVVMGMVLTLISLLQNMKYYKVTKMASTQEPPTKHTLYGYASIVKHIRDTISFNHIIQHLKTQFCKTF